MHEGDNAFWTGYKSYALPEAPFGLGINLKAKTFSFNRLEGKKLNLSRITYIFDDEVLLILRYNRGNTPGTYEEVKLGSG